MIVLEEALVKPLLIQLQHLQVATLWYSFALVLRWPAGLRSRLWLIVERHRELTAHGTRKRQWHPAILRHDSGLGRLLHAHNCVQAEVGRRLG